jgi:ATP-binding protein involved in chromosome partitioning
MSGSEHLARVLGEVVEPALGRSLADLGLLGQVERGMLGTGRVHIRMPFPNYPLTDELTRRLRDLGGERLAVELDMMTTAEATSFITGLVDKSGPRVGASGSATRVIAVSSGKGGVGKSSITTNLAIALGRQGKKVGVIDADIWGFSIPKMLGISHAPLVLAETIIPPLAYGIKAMSMDYFVPDDKAVVWRGPMLHKAIEQFLTDVFWDNPDYLIVDMPPGTGDIAISMSQFLPRAQVLLVTTPQPTAQRVARRAALMADTVNQEVVGVVENMSWFTGEDGKRYELFGRGGGQALADEIGVPLFAQIPLLPAMREGADHGLPVAIAAPGSEAAEAFESLAQGVMGRKPRVRSHPQLVINP